jgi:hypothetical protein
MKTELKKKVQFHSLLFKTSQTLLYLISFEGQFFRGPGMVEPIAYGPEKAFPGPHAARRPRVVQVW